MAPTTPNRIFPVVAKLLYCWHCKAERLMLDEAEWAQIVPLLSDGIAQPRRTANVTTFH